MMKQNLYEACRLHPNEYLQMICQQCEQACLACPQCIDQFHSGHPMISLKKFISSQIPKLYETKPSIQKVTKGIEQMRLGFLLGFETMRKKIGSQINEIQNEYNIEAEILKQQIEVICGQGAYNMQNIAAIKHKLQQNMKIPNQQKLETQLCTILKQVNLLLNQTTETLCKSIRELKQYWSLSCGVILNSRKKSKHYFSQKYKHQLIDLMPKTNKKSQKDDGSQLQDKTVAINTTFDSKYHIVVVEPPLNPFKNEVNFKIEQSVNNCVWIGVCDLEKVKDKLFENCYKKNQGCYWIWQSGGEEECQFFSSLINQSVSLDSCIKVGDTISVRLDYSNEGMNKISFYKIETEKDTDLLRRNLKKSVPCLCSIGRLIGNCQDSSMKPIEPLKSKSP